MSKNPKENGVHLPFNDNKFIEKWQEWLQYRKERRLAAYVPTGLKQTFAKLLNISNNDVSIAIQIIDQSISNGWQGLFELKTLPNATNIPTITCSDKPIGTSGSRIQAAKDF